MAYDKDLFDKIDKMGAGDLVHFMLVEFVKPRDLEDEIDRSTCMQSVEYFRAYECLNAMLPGKSEE